MHLAGASGRSNFPSPNFTLISQELAADKNSPSLSFVKSWRARRFSFSGEAGGLLRFERRRPLACLFVFALIAAALRSDELPSDQKLKRSNKSLIAGLFVGTYGPLEVDVVGFARLSRLRPVTFGSFQFRSMNFKIETWSA
jgi:hypothetical protein